MSDVEKQRLEQSEVRVEEGTRILVWQSGVPIDIHTTIEPYDPVDGVEERKGPGSCRWVHDCSLESSQRTGCESWMLTGHETVSHQSAHQVGQQHRHSGHHPQSSLESAFASASS